MRPVDTGRRIALEASLLAEAIVGITLIVVLAERMDLHDFAVILPVGLVVGGVGLAAFAVRKRFLFWCGALGATVGGVCPKPQLYVTFGRDADPADVAVIWSRMIGEINFQYAFVGCIMCIALACAIVHFRRRCALRALTTHSA